MTPHDQFVQSIIALDHATQKTNYVTENQFRELGYVVKRIPRPVSFYDFLRWPPAVRHSADLGDDPNWLESLPPSTAAPGVPVPEPTHAECVAGVRQHWPWWQSNVHYHAAQAILNDPHISFAAIYDRVRQRRAADHSVWAVREYEKAVVVYRGQTDLGCHQFEAEVRAHWNFCP